MARLPRDWRRLVRLALIVLALLVAMLAVLLVPPWLRAIAPPSAARRAAIAFLVGLEVAYLTAFATASVGILIFGSAFYRARRRRTPRLMVARGLLACSFGLVAFALA